MEEKHSIQGSLMEGFFTKNEKPRQPILKRYQRQNRGGAMMVFIAFCLVILFVTVAFSIDIAYMHVARAELRTTADAAARAAAEALGRTQDIDEARQAAINFARLNRVNGEPLILDESDIEFGTSRKVGEKFEFVPNANPPVAVRVTARRTPGSASGPIPLFFGNVLGTPEFSPTQSATASRIEMDIALVLDISGSMNANGRFDALKNAIAVFVAELNKTPQEELCSMSLYSTNAEIRVELTSQLESLRTELDEVRPNGMTAIGRGMEKGIETFQHPNSRPFAFKSMIVMTDGQHNTGVNPLDIVPDATQAGITVHTITFSRGANQNLMENVANEGNGIHLHADTDEQLVQAFKEIANQLTVVLIE